MIIYLSIFFKNMIFLKFYNFLFLKQVFFIKFYNFLFLKQVFFKKKIYPSPNPKKTIQKI